MGYNYPTLAGLLERREHNEADHRILLALVAKSDLHTRREIVAQLLCDLQTSGRFGRL